MIWTILLTIIAIIAGVFVILCSLVIFSTVYIGAAFTYAENKRSISLDGWWLHPWVAKVKTDHFKNSLTIQIFGYTLKPRSVRTSEVKESVGLHEETKSVSKSTFGETPSAEESHRKEGSDLTDRTEKEIIPSPPEQAPPLEELNTATETVSFKRETSEKVPTETSHAQQATPKFEDEQSIEVSVEGEGEKTQEQTSRESLFNRLKRNRYLYIALNRKWQTKMVRWLIRFVKYLFRIISFDRLIVSIKVGIKEPALLGKVFGFYEMIRYSLKVGRGYHLLRFEPVFMKYHFEGEGSFGLRTSVAQVLFPVVMALVTFPYFTTLLLFWKSRKLKNE